jgi:hypothetical protein
MKHKFIKVKGNQRTIKIIIDKVKWKNLALSVVEFILIFTILSAVALIILCPIGMVNTWSITPAHLIAFFSSLAWLGLIWIYCRKINK